MSQYHLSDIACWRCSQTGHLCTETEVTEIRRSGWEFIGGAYAPEGEVEGYPSEGPMQLLCENCARQNGVLLREFDPGDLEDCETPEAAREKLQAMEQEQAGRPADSPIHKAIAAYGQKVYDLAEAEAREEAQETVDAARKRADQAFEEAVAACRA